MSATAKQPTTATLEQQYQSSHLYGSNAPFIEALYEAYLENPASIPEHWQQVFSKLLNGTTGDTGHLDIQARFRELGYQPSSPTAGHELMDHKQAGVLKMLNAYRVRGHEKAQIDPLGLLQRPQIPDLSLEAHDLSEEDLGSEFDTGSLAAPERMRLQDIVELCENVYCRSIGTEYMHIIETDERRWLQERLEGSRGDYAVSTEQKHRILQKLTAAEGLEKYLHTKYVGQKRFSLEGGESLIPLLYEAIRHFGKQGVKEAIVGMAHRGRLNVLINILGKSPERLFAEFEGRAKSDDPLRSGDVKYHMGYSADMPTPGGDVHIALAFNPSHLEIVDPVVVGSTRARQVRREDFGNQQVVPILIHGDAAFAGQGVVMELAQMSEARGFAVGGTLHIVVNNQIGFTISNPDDARSTQYCTAIAKMVQAPIFHVNADDPEAVQFVTKLACDFRNRFKRDVVIDLICYRRHGHNEADEPAATQPMMYQNIRALKTTRAKYAEKLINQGVLDQAQVRQMMDAYRDALDQGQDVAEVRANSGHGEMSVDWSPYLDVEWTHAVKTGVPAKKIRSLSDKLTRLPEGFELHSRVQKIISDRNKMAIGELPMDWGFAETAAYASLIDQGYGLRLVGQDSGRGTFFHRHAVLHNQADGNTLLPLAKLASKANVSVTDSLLSEEAVLGFEYGYATTDPDTLVIWEAQFGDFVNGAQVVIDQFISSGEAKWGRLCGLVMFLPHGYEGQGPEHSSARLERFMQLCADNNIQVCIPSTPAQMFHMLRRQMIRPYRKPLIVMTPKSLLRNKASVSTLEELDSGSFQLVIDDTLQQSKSVRRIVLCSGKVYYDLAAARDEQKLDNVAIVRIEQLYPFPLDQVINTLQQYSKANEVTWCQEEPMNQGAWYQIKHHIQSGIESRHKLHYAGRPSSASPAVGYYSAHLAEQKALVQQALTVGAGIIQ